MKYQIKATKEAFYKVSDWTEEFDYERQDAITDAANSMRWKDTGELCLPTPRPLSNRKNKFKLIDWNQWDKDQGRIKDMYIEFYDYKLDMMFNLALGDCIERKVYED